MSKSSIPKPLQIPPTPKAIPSGARAVLTRLQRMAASGSLPSDEEIEEARGLMKIIEQRHLLYCTPGAVGGSPAYAPRTVALLQEMLRVLETGEQVRYWKCFEVLLDVHDEMLVEERAQV